MTRLVDWRPLPGRNASREKFKADDRPKPLPAHVGAWLDRYLWEGPSPTAEKPGRMALLETAVESLTKCNPAACSWLDGYRRWKRGLVDESTGVHQRDAILVTKGRLLLHVGSGSSVTDGSILLHHTWGVPYIPGSALKGVVRSALTDGSLRQHLRIVNPEGLADPEALADLLGAGPSDQQSERAAFIDFLDAPWVPPDPWTCDWSPLALDVVTPHHVRYYTDSGSRPFPTDFDEPVPTHRLSISPRTQFHVVIEAHKSVPKPWLEFVMDKVLLPALLNDGIGAWTTSGYGRMTQRETDATPG